VPTTLDQNCKLFEETEVEDVQAAATAGLVLLSLSECPRCGDRIEPHQVSVAVYEHTKARWECPWCDYSAVVRPEEPLSSQESVCPIAVTTGVFAVKIASATRSVLKAWRFESLPRRGRR